MGRDDTASHALNVRASNVITRVEHESSNHAHGQHPQGSGPPPPTHTHNLPNLCISSTYGVPGDNACLSLGTPLLQTACRIFRAKEELAKQRSCGRVIGNQPATWAGAGGGGECGQGPAGSWPEQERSGLHLPRAGRTGRLRGTSI